MSGGERFDVFISYHWQDRERVEVLAQGLRKEGLKVFLDRWYLTPGQPWPQRLEEILGQCGAVAVFIGPGEMGPWQQREANQALVRQTREPGFPVIPVLLPGAEPPLGFLGQNTWVEYRGGEDPGLLALLAAAIRGAPPGPELQARLSETLVSLCPYRGLLYFREEDAPFFFGREEGIKQLRAGVARHKFIAVVGASGCGKSSLVRAGLLPALRQEEAWELATIIPGDRPLRALAGGLLPLLEPAMTETEQLIEVGKLGQAFQEGGVRLLEVTDRALAKQAGSQRLLLVVDQWEELFTLTADEVERRRFLDLILEATDKGKLTVVLTLRGDFFGRAITSYRPLSDRLQEAQVNLGPMTLEELRRAVVEPAKKVGLNFESGLVDLILEQTGEEPGHLPLLEFVLRRLWEERRGGLLHHAAFQAMGGLTGAIASRAEQVFGKLPVAEQREVHQIFLRLVRPGEGQADTRRRATLEECGEKWQSLVSKLASERLLVTAHGTTPGEQTVEVAHEALIRHWQRLQGWINEDRRFLTWQQHLNADAAEWRESGQRPELLLRGLPLTEARQWLKQRRENLSPLEVSYIEKSRRRIVRHRVLAGVGTALIFLVVLALWINASREKTRAQNARERAEKLVDFMIDDLWEKLGPVGHLDLMVDVNRQVEQYYRAMGIHSKEQDRRRAVAFNNEGDVQWAQGKLSEARRYYEAALAIFERLSAQDPQNTEWQRDLAVSHNRVGNLLQAEGKLAEAGKAYEASLQIRRRLVEQDPNNNEWQQDLAMIHREIGNELKEEGKLSEARRAYGSSLVIAEHLAKQDPGKTNWQKDLAENYEKLGDILVDEGNLPEARRNYELALSIREGLAKQDPKNSIWQFDLSVIHIRIGNVLNIEGKLPEAQKSYDSALALAKRLTQQDPKNTQWQQGLALIHEKVGDTLVVQGKRVEARQALEASLDIHRLLAAQDPQNAGWQRDLVVSYDRVGDVLKVEGKLQEAREYYEKGLAIRERLVKQDKDNTNWQRDLAVGYQKMGDLLRTEGKLPEAKRFYESALEITQRLVKLDPKNAKWQYDLTIGYKKVGDLMAAAGKLVEARRSYEYSLTICQRLAQQDPGNANWQQNLSECYAKIGDVLKAENKLPEARDSFMSALEINKRMAEQVRENAVWQRDLSVSYNKVGDVLKDERKYSEAQEFYKSALEIRKELAEKDPQNAEWQYDLMASYGKMGLLLADQGKTAAALQNLEAGRAVATRLIQMAPNNARWRQDLDWFDQQIAGFKKDR